jgi:hypothetical protein
VTGLLELSHDHGHEQKKMVSIFALLSSNAGGKKN